MIDGSYSENPGVPTEEERGTYCPHGEKIVETWYSAYLGDFAHAVVEPWPCHKPGCTLERFLAEQAEMERELNEEIK